MTRRVGIIGYPVGHSISPAFQQAAFDALQIDARYERWETPADALADRVESLRASDVLGANVTVPHKEAVVPLLDELDAGAARMGAVNTIVNVAGRLRGSNTDGQGFVAALRGEVAFDPAGCTVLLIGAGGAARGIAFALADAGVASIDLVNRTPARATRLAADLAAIGATANALSRVGDPSRYDVVVNTTSVGMHGTGTETDLPLPVDGLRADALAVDIVYNPAETAFLRAAHGRGLPTLGGLPMLVYQGALAFELWTGRQPPVEVMMAAAAEALRARGE